MESASRWLVGSSSSRISAPENRILDSSTRRRWPPERVDSGWPSTRSSRASAEAIDAASDSAAYPPRAVNSPSSRAVAAHGLLTGLVVATGHRGLRGPHVGDDPVEAARREDAVPCQHLQVPGARVLRQVAHLARGCDAAGGGLALAGQHLGERGLAGSVAADEAHAVPGGDAEGRVVEQQARTRAQLDPAGGDHYRLQTFSWGRGTAPGTGRGTPRWGCGYAADGLRSLVYESHPVGLATPMSGGGPMSFNEDVQLDTSQVSSGGRGGAAPAAWSSAAASAASSC